MDADDALIAAQFGAEVAGGIVEEGAKKIPRKKFIKWLIAIIIIVAFIVIYYFFFR